MPSPEDDCPKETRQATISNKRPKLEDLVAPEPPPEAEQEPVKRKLFQRKEALTGQLRTYKILMKPTTAQREEFERWRCFEFLLIYYYCLFISSILPIKHRLEMCLVSAKCTNIANP